MDDDQAFYERLTRVLGPGPLSDLGLYELPPAFVLSVAIPVFNEHATIEEIIRRVRAAPPPRKEIIIVDDFSTDGTREVLRGLQGQADLKIVFAERNRGKGAALRTAFQQATGDVVIVQDADLEYDPQEYRRLIQPIVDGRADVVYGSRFKGQVVRVHLFWHRVANAVLTTFSNVFTNLNLSDMETCYKAFRTDIVKRIPIRENRFGVEPELTAKIARRKCRVYEVPISYRGRDYAEGKKIRLKDAFRAFYCVIRYALAD